ncbi:hypothetical protein [uncultured Desulfuromonas sp.]|uniref:hypothetical protein n=1 Tax=uncultured Desulfuromonas sp. TaxID=181013 RepID=UPI002AAC022B|nr:hypothetical protein [uncultured Desulfuromonas sp.]
MPVEELVHKSSFDFSDRSYTICIYRRADGFTAMTEFSPEDMIINDGGDIQSLLEKHRRLLPLAIISRQMMPEKERKRE